MFLVELHYKNGQRVYLPASYRRRSDAIRTVLCLALMSSRYARLEVIEMAPEGQTIH